jgi:short-subunit dehydrogenase
MDRTSKKTALVTGASSGIGKELAELCARDGHDLVLVARRRDHLQTLQADWSNRYQIWARVVSLDLADPTAPERLHDELSGEEIDVLINNAGFGTFGAFAESDTTGQLEMIRLNIATVTHLTRLFLPSMLRRDRGRIMNVASTAAFLPGPLMAVYYATKAYVLSFSEALVEELQGSGVTVTAFCPGPTATGFQARAKLDGSRLLRLGLVDAGPVAEEGYRAMMNGKAVVIPGIQNKLVAQWVRLTPRFLVRKVVKLVQSKVKDGS